MSRTSSETTASHRVSRCIAQAYAHEGNRIQCRQLHPSSCFSSFADYRPFWHNWIRLVLGKWTRNWRRGSRKVTLTYCKPRHVWRDFFFEIQGISFHHPRKKKDTINCFQYMIGHGSTVHTVLVQRRISSLLPLCLNTTTTCNWFSVNFRTRHPHSLFLLLPLLSCPCSPSSSCPLTTLTHNTPLVTWGLFKPTTLYGPADSISSSSSSPPPLLSTVSSSCRSHYNPRFFDSDLSQPNSHHVWVAFLYVSGSYTEYSESQYKTGPYSNWDMMMLQVSDKMEKARETVTERWQQPRPPAPPCPICPPSLTCLCTFWTPASQLEFGSFLFGKRDSSWHFCTAVAKTLIWFSFWL